MDALKAWLQDKKNMPIVLAATGIVFVLAILLILRMNGFIGGPKQAAIPDAGMPGAPAPGQGMPPQPGMPAEPPPPGTPPAPGTAPAPTSAAGQQAALAPMLPYRKDPFVDLRGARTTADVLASMLPRLSRPRLAPAPVSETEMASAEEVLPPQPFRRMSGVLWNGKVSAIMETNGETDVVRPGMELTRGNSKVRVESITQDSIILKTLDTRTPFTIKVNMAGSVASATGGPASQQPIYGGSGPIYPGAPPGAEPPPPGM
jgi:hypothetical protein